MDLELELKRLAHKSDSPVYRRYSVIDALKHKFSIVELCKALEVHRSGYYAHKVKKAKANERKKNKLIHEEKAIAEIKRLWIDSDKTIGYRAIYKKLLSVNIKYSANNIRNALKLLRLKYGQSAKHQVTPKNQYEHFVLDLIKLAWRGSYLYFSIIIDVFDGIILTGYLDDKSGYKAIHSSIDCILEQYIPPTKHVQIYPNVSSRDQSRLKSFLLDCGYYNCVLINDDKSKTNGFTSEGLCRRFNQAFGTKLQQHNALSFNEIKDAMYHWLKSENRRVRASRKVRNLIDGSEAIGTQLEFYFMKPKGYMASQRNSGTYRVL